MTNATCDGGVAVGIHSYRQAVPRANRISLWAHPFPCRAGRSAALGLFSRILEKTRPLAEKSSSDRPASRARGSGPSVLMNQLVAHERDLPSIGRPAGYVHRPLAAEEPGQNLRDYAS